MFGSVSVYINMHLLAIFLFAWKINSEWIVNLCLFAMNVSLYLAIVNLLSRCCYKVHNFFFPYSFSYHFHLVPLLCCCLLRVFIMIENQLNGTNFVNF